MGARCTRRADMANSGGIVGSHRHTGIAANAASTLDKGSPVVSYHGHIVHEIEQLRVPKVVRYARLFRLPRPEKIWGQGPAGLCYSGHKLPIPAAPCSTGHPMGQSHERARHLVVVVVVASVVGQFCHSVSTQIAMVAPVLVDRLFLTSAILLIGSIRRQVAAAKRRCHS